MKKTYARALQPFTTCSLQPFLTPLVCVRHLSSLLLDSHIIRSPSSFPHLLAHRPLTPSTLARQIRVFVPCPPPAPCCMTFAELPRRFMGTGGRPEAGIECRITPAMNSNKLLVQMPRPWIYRKCDPQYAMHTYKHDFSLDHICSQIAFECRITPTMDQNTVLVQMPRRWSYRKCDSQAGAHIHTNGHSTIFVPTAVAILPQAASCISA